MRRQFRKEYTEGRKKEEKSSFEIKENPKVKEYYSSYKMSEKKPIITEKYKVSSPNSKNIQSSNEYYKYYSEYNTPYNQRNQNMSQNNMNQNFNQNTNNNNHIQFTNSNTNQTNQNIGGTMPSNIPTGTYDPFPNSNNKLNIAFTTQKGQKMIIVIPRDSPVKELLKMYVLRCGLGPAVLNNSIFFVYNGLKINNFEQKSCGEFFNFSGANIVVLDTKNIIGA